MEAPSCGLPAAKRVEEPGTAFGINTAAADMLKLVEGGILEAISVATGASKMVFHKPLLGLANQHLNLPLRALTWNGASFEGLLQGSEADSVSGTVDGAVEHGVDHLECQAPHGHTPCRRGLNV